MAVKALQSAFVAFVAASAFLSLSAVYIYKPGWFEGKYLSQKQSLHPRVNATEDCSRGTNCISNRDAVAQKMRDHALELMELQRSFLSDAGAFIRLNKQVEAVNEIILMLKGDELKNNNTFAPKIPRPASTGKQEVCPEIFKGENLLYGQSYWRKGFERESCTEFVPIEDLLTLLMYVPEELPKPSMNYFEIMQGVEKYYPKMKVILATTKPIEQSRKSAIAQLNIIFKNEVVEGNHQGKLWGNLVKQVETPYALLAPRITHFDDDIDLYRLVRMISYNAGTVSVAGGSYRDVNGHWTFGCEQVTYRNWTAYYKAGYYQSFNESVPCDFVPGPFVVRTSVLKELGIDESLPYGAFHDLFWRVKRRPLDNMAVVCPDVMFKVQSREVKDEEYAGFANKHLIKKIVGADGKARWYGCRRGVPYTKSNLCRKPDGFGIPPCDLANLADVVKATMRICEESHVFCEFGAGTLLGAVKFGSVIPWEKDADIIFLSSNYTGIEKVKSKFQQAGFSISGSKSTYGCCDSTGRIKGGWFEVYTTRWRLEIFGRPWLESHDVAASGQVRTRVPFDGEWLISPRNPGLFARNRYGPGCLQHVEWKGGWSFYNAGRFRKCPNPGHSACLDQYPVDGNMQFSDYNSP